MNWICATNSNNVPILISNFLVILNWLKECPYFQKIVTEVLKEYWGIMSATHPHAKKVFKIKKCESKERGKRVKGKKGENMIRPL